MTSSVSSPHNGVATAAGLTSTGSITLHSGGLTVKAYRGDDSVMLVMNIDQSLCDELAGFAIARSVDAGATWTFLPNRLSFKAAKGVTATTDPNVEIDQRDTSDVAPFQKFHWIDVPPQTLAAMQYRVVARYFVDGRDPAVDPARALQDGPSVLFSIDATTPTYPHFRVAFTRGYISSQAFDVLFAGVQAIRPASGVMFNEHSPVPGAAKPTTWLQMYTWLGAHARALIVEFADTCTSNQADLDVFAYDLDEPNFITFLEAEAKKGRSVRLILDDSALHTKPGAREITAAADLAKAGVQVKRGHFHRYAHDKCVIAKKSDRAFSVLTGSANFSVRGLYVQSNSVIVIDEPATADLYAQAFEEAWDDMSSFAGSEIASQWFDGPQSHDVPRFSVSFAPHKDAAVSLERVAQAIGAAKSSVLFAVMELGGGGPVLDALRTIQKNQNVFSYGITQTIGGLKFYKSKVADGELVPFAFLDKNVPTPFAAEWRGGPGQIIHHKFVVIDFNAANPIVFCGSSNLAQGGEEQNGDNMLAITDPAIAALYAIEAIKLVDHYEFRFLQSTAKAPTALGLEGPAASPPWWKSVFDPNDIKYRERLVFLG
jgi:phosphatidylserine/phosphatidylglycerophosphate/cardiolipin synthase-like enzyme